MNSPNYHKIYTDLIKKNYPDKIELFQRFLEKKQLSTLDILKINDELASSKNRENIQSDQKHRSYSRSDILYILHYQKKNKLNNSQLANQFKMSRNTITRWKKLFTYGLLAKDDNTTQKSKNQNITK